MPLTVIFVELINQPRHVIENYFDLQAHGCTSSDLIARMFIIRMLVSIECHFPCHGPNESMPVPLTLTL
jgi:hypothetical protein